MKVIKQVIFCLAVAAGAGVQAGENPDYLAMVEAEASHADVSATGDRGSAADNDLMQQRIEELKTISPSAYSIYQRLQPHYRAEVNEALQRGDDIYTVRELIILRNG